MSAETNNSGDKDDFPIVCETCLGSNPYLKMTKKPFGDKLCKMSKIPFQGYKWKAGTTGRYKETIVCKAVATERNICQACLNDMKYGLPVGVRDAVATQPSNKIALPESTVGQQYYFQQLEASGTQPSSSSQSLALEIVNAVPDQQIKQFAKIQQSSSSKNSNSSSSSGSIPFRNLPKLCSFWLNGRCERVKRKTCPYRPCCGTFVFPEIAQKHELHQQLITQLNEQGVEVVQNKLSQEHKNAFRESMKGNKDEAIRKRVMGEDDLSKNYVNKIKSMKMELEPPADPNICSLYLGNIDEGLNEEHIKQYIYPYGYFTNVHIVRASKCAFVDYIDRSTAENAAKQMYNNLIIYDRVITVNWASKPRTTVAPPVHSVAFVPASMPYYGYNNGMMVMPPPPGMEYAPYGMYGLTGMAMPTVGYVRPRESEEESSSNKKQAVEGVQYISSFSKNDK